MRDPSRNPLFQVGLQLLSDGTTGGTLALADVEAETLTPQVQRSRFDLSVTFTETVEHELTVSVEYVDRPVRPLARASRWSTTSSAC